MTDELPAQWALDKAAVVAGYQDWVHLHQFHDHGARTGRLATALARYIEKHEPAPVDPDLELAREAAAEFYAVGGAPAFAARIVDGKHDAAQYVQSALLAIRKLKERGK